MGVPDILQNIIEVKRDEVARLKARVTVESLREQSGAWSKTRGVLDALRRQSAGGDMALIAEVKKASPSRGVIRADFDPVWIAERYCDGGATCLSVLTDQQFFQGRLDFLASIRASVPLPLLRKDFTIDRIQLYEARAAGADAILLIAACLEPGLLRELHDEAVAIGLDVLVEIHDEREWEGILASGLTPPLVGVNNRNLHDFTVTLETTEILGPMVTAGGSVLVAESGIFTPADVDRLSLAGASAILVGESLMKDSDPGAAARRLMDSS